MSDFHPLGATDLIAVSAIVVGFGVTAMMFRVQRELDVEKRNLKVEKGDLDVEEMRKNEPPRQEQPLWLAWADYLIITSVGLAVFGTTVPLLVLPGLSERLVALAAASCVAAVVLQAGYVPSILAHYRIELGSGRKGLRQKGEPLERLFVIGTGTLAAITFVITLFLRLAASQTT